MAYAILAMFVLVPVPPQRPAVAAIEMTFATHAGEGAVGRKRVDRNGCYQSESEGRTGVVGRAHDSEAGCHRADDVERVFALIAGLPLRAEVAATLPDEHNRVVVVRADDTRWVAADDQGARELVRLVNSLPSDNQWYAQPPANPVGNTAQLVALAVSDTGGAGGVRRLEAVVAADGRWWCHRSVPVAVVQELQLARKRAKPLSPAEARARLATITAGLSPPGSGRDDGAAAARTGHGVNRTVEVAFAGGPRAPARPRHKAADVAKRFEARMRPMAAACALP